MASTTHQTISMAPWKKEQLERQDAATRETHVWGRVGFRVSFSSFSYLFRSTTVDGGNPAPVDMEKLPLFIGFYTSQVVQDFFHQQYDSK